MGRVLALFILAAFIYALTLARGEPEAEAQSAQPLTKVANFSATLAASDAGFPTGTQVSTIIPTSGIQPANPSAYNCRTTIINRSGIKVWVGGFGVTKNTGITICNDLTVCDAKGVSRASPPSSIYVIAGQRVDGGENGLIYEVSGGGCL